MKPQKHKFYYKFILTILCLLGGLITNKSVSAQLTPDNKLGTESSVVTKVNEVKDIIHGGATRGANLFHSFQEFNIGVGKSVYFGNPTGIENILTRVTGGNFSNILGTLGVEGTANLFLINPNGIYFGNGARLDIQGSFTATTVDGIRLGENGLFSASNPQNSNLLTVQPGALFRNAIRNQQAEIRNEGNLQVGKNLTFDADNINISGTLQAGENLTLKANHTISIDGCNINADNYETGQGGDINISTAYLYVNNHSRLSARTFGKGDAGSVNIAATDSVKFDGNSAASSQVRKGATGTAGGVNISTKSLELLGGSILSASTFGEGDASSVKITATDSVKFNNDSYAQSAVAPGAVGKAGNVEISTNSLELLGRSSLDANTFGKGNAGSVKITATGAVKFDGQSYAASQVKTEAVATAGDVDIAAQSLELLGGSYLDASTFGQGDAGSVKITATNSVKFDGQSYAASQVTKGAVGKSGGLDIYSQYLEVLGGSFLDVSTKGTGDAGSVKITATNSVKFDGNSNAASQVNTGAVGTAGGVNISTKSLELLGGSVLTASTFAQGDAGSVKITATDSVKFDSQSSAQSGVGTRAVGAAGGVEIFTKSLEILGGSYLYISVFGKGDGGSIKLTATDSIKFDDNSIAESAVAPGAIGKAGGVDISTQSLELLGASYLSASTFGQGNAGIVKITATDSIKFDGNSSAESAVGQEAVGKAGGVEIFTKSLELLGASYLSTSTYGQGNADGVTITATDTIKFDGQSYAASQVASGGVGKAGNIEIHTQFLEMYSGSFISASTFGQGDAGSVTITATDSIKFDSESNAASRVATGAVGKAGGVKIFTKFLELLGASYLSASTYGQGNAGTVNITANTFTATTGGQVLTTTSGSAQAGNINLIVKDNITLDGNQTGLFANTEIGSTGNSGSITIDPQTFIIRNGARIGVNSQGTGEGGDISVQAGLLSLNNQAFISAETASNQGGNINLAINDLLLLRNNSRISATAGTAQGGGNGGNITINAPFIVAFPKENSDITANAFEGNGGNINITTNALFGIEFRLQETQRSDITASSEFGIAGNVQINRPDVDPTSGLLELPGNLVDAESLNKDVCAIKDDKIAGGSSFIITGKGGLPADTDELISHSPAYLEWETNTETVTESKPADVKVSQENKNDVPEIQEAQGWVITTDGRVFLTANPKKVTLRSDKNNLPNCK